MSDLIDEQDGFVLRLTLNQPDKKNAFSPDMVGALAAAIESAATDDAVRVVVLTGAGDAFSAGGDLSRRSKESAEGATPSPFDRMNRLQTGTHRLARAIDVFDKPLMAAVNGAAAGAGMDLALMCDIRYASRQARFCEAYIRVGLIPGNAGCHFLPRLIGTGRALELLWSGDWLSAEDAERIGLVNRLFDVDQLMPETLAFAHRLAGGPSIQQRLIKRLVRQCERSDLKTSLEYTAAAMAVAQGTADYQEAIAAYREKRAGRFEGK
ncbi:MAG: enoyl-CoA hydratase/isomerase family protein [Proteobacteria bacterium]|nr:enoyl-CoA hydratase/isomerase family protein [Burkholderiales bacterium]